MKYKTMRESLLFILSVCMVTAIFSEKGWSEETVYRVSFPAIKDGDKNLSIRYYQVLARYYVISELQKEVKDFAPLCITSVTYEDADDKLIFNVSADKTMFIEQKNLYLDDEVKEIFELIKEELKTLSDEGLSQVYYDRIIRIEKDMELFNLVRDYELYSNTGRAQIRQRIRELENRLTAGYERDIKLALLLSYLNLKAGYGIKAEEIVKNAIKFNQESFVLKNRYGIILKELGKFDEAIGQFNELIEKYKEPISYFYLGMTYKNKEECREAIKYLSEFVKLETKKGREEIELAKNAIDECKEGFRKNTKKGKKHWRNR